MPNFVLNGHEFYDAPKNGGTTVRMWLTLYEGGLPEQFAPQGYYNLAGVGGPKSWHNNTWKAPRFFSPGAPENRRWCIVRDPVERFISAYTDKILRARLASWTVDTCLALLESGEMDTLAKSQEKTSLQRAAYHFLGQCAWFGQDRGYFDHVFHIRNMNRVREFCEDTVFRMALPEFHARDQSSSDIRKIELTRTERQRAENIYADDYAANWC